MNIDDTLITRLATLSRLRFDEETMPEIKINLNKILALVEKLQEVDTENVKPLVYMTDHVNVLREDVIQESVGKEEALKNAPDSNSDYFKVPKVISK